MPDETRRGRPLDKSALRIATTAKRFDQHPTLPHGCDAEPLLTLAARAEAVSSIFAAHLARRPGWDLQPDGDLAWHFGRLLERLAADARLALAAAA